MRFFIRILAQMGRFFWHHKGTALRASSGALQTTAVVASASAPLIGATFSHIPSIIAAVGVVASLLLFNVVIPLIKNFKDYMKMSRISIILFTLSAATLIGVYATSPKTVQELRKKGEVVQEKAKKFFKFSKN